MHVSNSYQRTLHHFATIFLTKYRPLTTFGTFNPHNPAYKDTRPSAIAFESIKQLLQQEPLLQSRFRKFGYLILQAPTADRELLFNVARLFGKVQGHVRSPLDGIVDVKSHFSDAADKQVNSKLPFFAHTDGHYLEGMAQQNNSVVRVVPPKIILLQCVQPAVEGGESFLVDAKAILLEMTKKRSPLLKTLFQRPCMSICRGNHLIMDVPVFEKRPSGHFSIRFSYDNDLYAPNGIMEDLDFFNQHYISNPTFTTSLPLKERQILVIDNHRHLHGRTEVIGERLFRRIWVQDESRSSLLFSLQNDTVPYYGSTTNMLEACAHNQAYMALPDIPGDRFKEFVTGVGFENNII
jgi:alpha-ketoglutarate-dependent taurine dioxygenase